MMHLRRYQDDGLFDRFGYHASELWSNGRNAWAEDQKEHAENASLGDDDYGRGQHRCGLQ